MDLNDALRELQQARQTLVDRLRELLENTARLSQQLTESEVDRRRYRVTLELILTKLEAIDFENEPVDARVLGEGLTQSIRNVLRPTGGQAAIESGEAAPETESSAGEAEARPEIPDSLPPWFDKYL